MKTEKEKMLAGKMYNPQDKELAAERLRAKKLCYKFNNLSPAAGEKKNLYWRVPHARAKSVIKSLQHSED